MVGPAGHIDHGKSSLVLALTGIDPDRLKEEKERGLTIDLGFARLRMADGRWLGMVDVPGHERFVRNMVAGSTALDLALLVVAADDGVMPQTREHLDILDLIGVRHGLVALTKVDLVDAETVAMAQEEVSELLEGTAFEGAPVLPVSATTGEGVEELGRKLQELALGIEPRSHEGPFRMPVQRGEDLGFPLEAGQPVGVGRERLRQHLQGYVAVERRVAGLPDFTHAACADLGGDGIGRRAANRGG
ncbi:MAG: GTP-binding protein, partial [Planctomycetota bacterium]